MDYLHGDVVDHVYEAACCYEYGKESKTLLTAARLKREDPSTPLEVIFCRLQLEHGLGWFIQDPWPSICECSGFPAKSWNQLTTAQRYDILRTFPSSEIRPLAMLEVVRHDGIGTFDKLKAMAAQARTEKTKKVFPTVNKQQWTHALFTLDFGKAKKRLMQEFEMWLDLPENKERLTAFKNRRIGRTGTFKDRLKDLAAWRLYQALGCDAALAFAEANRKKDKADRFRPFHDPRHGQSKSTPLNQAPLYSEESAFLKAKARALEYLAEVMPGEFGGKPEAEDPFSAALRNAANKAQKISRSPR